MLSVSFPIVYLARIF